MEEERERGKDNENGMRAEKSRKLSASIWLLCQLPALELLGG